MRSFLSLVAVVFAGSAFAQDAPKPGKEHEILKSIAGDWDITMKVAGQEAKGTCTYKSDLGGFWLASTLECDMFGQKFTGKGMDGYCPIKKKYISTWMDSMGASPVIMEGDYDADKKTFTLSGDGPSPEGKMTKYKSVSEHPDANTIKMSMYIGDGKEPMFTVEYKRKKADAKK